MITIRNSGMELGNWDRIKRVCCNPKIKAINIGILKA